MIRLLRACTAVSRPLRHAFAILLLAGTAMAGDAMATTYRIVALPLPPSSTGGTVLDVNATGDAVGLIGVDGQSLVVEWSPPDYVMRVLLLPDEDIVVLQDVAINDAGDILGFGIARGDDGNDLNLNMLWKSDGSFVRLAVDTQRGKGTDAEVRDINNHGVVVGMVWGTRNALPAVWSKTGVLLPVSVAPLGSEAMAVNDSGMVAGGGYGGSRVFKHAFRWAPGSGVLDLGDLVGGSGLSYAYDVNNSGQIVGYSVVSSPTPVNRQAVLWDADGTIHDLGRLPGDPGNLSYEAHRINNFGVVLGGDGYTQTWLWTAGTGMVSIDSMIDPDDPMHDAGYFEVNDLGDDGTLAGDVYLAPNYSQVIPILLVPQP